MWLLTCFPVPALHFTGTSPFTAVVTPPHLAIATALPAAARLAVAAAPPAAADAPLAVAAARLAVAAAPPAAADAPLAVAAAPLAVAAAPPAAADAPLAVAAAYAPLAVAAAAAPLAATPLAVEAAPPVAPPMPGPQVAPMLDMSVYTCNDDSGFIPLSEMQHRLYARAVSSSGKASDIMSRHDGTKKKLTRADMRKCKFETMLNDEVCNLQIFSCQTISSYSFLSLY